LFEFKVTLSPLEVKVDKLNPKTSAK